MIEAVMSVRGESSTSEDESDVEWEEVSSVAGEWISFRQCC